MLRRGGFLSSEGERRVAPTLPWWKRGYPQLFERCYECLDSHGIGPLELSAMKVSVAGDVAKQLSFEMNIPYGSYLEEAVATLIQDAKLQRNFLIVATGAFGTDLEW